MPLCENRIRAAAFSARWCLLCVLLVACEPAANDFGFTIESVESRSSARSVIVTLHQKINLSGEARDALVHGVPLTITTEMQATSAVDSERRNSVRIWEIRYLPLSGHYQLTSESPLMVKTFPRLRHALAELNQVDLEVTVPAAHVLEIRVRSFLDKAGLPPPMRLPTLLSSRWDHDSGWHVYRVNTAAG